MRSFSLSGATRQVGISRKRKESAVGHEDEIECLSPHLEENVANNSSYPQAGFLASWTGK
jgi:hypothetical protein